jgi:hypothetical protein
MSEMYLFKTFIKNEIKACVENIIDFYLCIVKQEDLNYLNKKLPLRMFNSTMKIQIVVIHILGKTVEEFRINSILIVYDHDFDIY